MFEKSHSGTYRWIQVFSSSWRSKDWTITLVQSVLFRDGRASSTALLLTMLKTMNAIQASLSSEFSTWWCYFALKTISNTNA